MLPFLKAFFYHLLEELINTQFYNVYNRSGVFILWYPNSVPCSLPFSEMMSSDWYIKGFLPFI